MMPPVDESYLPKWVRDKLHDPKIFKVGDLVYGILYNEPDGIVLEVSNEEGWIRVGWAWDNDTHKFSKIASGSIHYYVKYDETSK